MLAPTTLPRATPRIPKGEGVEPPAREPVKAIAFVDIETTGLDPARHDILEVAVVRVDPDTLQVLEEKSVLVQPERLSDADPEALAVCGYSASVWSRAIPLKWALRAIAPLLEDALIAGHNVGFDWSFLEAGFRRAGLPLPRVDYHRLDTASLAWLLMANDEVDSVSLDAVCEQLDIARPRPHRALEDARCAHQVAMRMLVRTQAGNSLAMLPDDERDIAEELINHLWDVQSLAGPNAISADSPEYKDLCLLVAGGLDTIVTRMVERRRAAQGRVRRVYVSHPFAGDPKGNIERVRGISRQLAAEGVLPVAPHLYLPQFLDERTERDAALRLCLELLGTCDEVRVFGAAISPGMQREIEHARAHGLPVHFETEMES